MIDKGLPAATNLYGILDNELTRLHNLLLAHLANDRGTMSHHIGNQGFGGSSGFGHTPPFYVQERITKIQDMILSTVLAHDEKLQEKIAEFALMSKDGDTKDEL